MKIKVCGITNIDDALYARDLGVDSIGLIFYEHGPRYVGPNMALKIRNALGKETNLVGVFVNHLPSHVEEITRFVGLNMIQLHGNELVADFRYIGKPLIKAVTHFQDLPSADFILIDSALGDEKAKESQLTSPEVKIIECPLPLILSGGLSADNVGERIAEFRPHAVDVSKGVEKSPGIKDHKKMQNFVTEVFKAFKRR